MNREHRELLASDGWRELLERLALPFAFDGAAYAELGPDVVEIGPGPGLTERLTIAGFVEVDVRTNAFAWAAHARRAEIEPPP